MEVEAGEVGQQDNGVSSGQITEADIEVDKVTELQDKTDELALSLFDALRFLPSARKANHDQQVRMYKQAIANGAVGRFPPCLEAAPIL
jgi:hypothetical protein